MSELGDKIREKLRKVSTGEYHTWGFVAMFMEMIDEAEQEVEETPPQPERKR